MPRLVCSPIPYLGTSKICIKEHKSMHMHAFVSFTQCNWSMCTIMYVHMPLYLCMYCIYVCMYVHTTFYCYFFLSPHRRLFFISAASLSQRSHTSPPGWEAQLHFWCCSTAPRPGHREGAAEEQLLCPPQLCVHQLHVPY